MTTISTVTGHSHGGLSPSGQILVSRSGVSAGEASAAEERFLECLNAFEIAFGGGSRPPLHPPLTM